MTFRRFSPLPFSLLALSTLASAAPAEPSDAGACYRANVTFLLPDYNAEDVSPAAVPVVGVQEGCVEAEIGASLSDGVNDPIFTSLDTVETGLLWFDQLQLQPDTDYELSVDEGDEADVLFLRYFRTGSGAIVPPEGSPVVTVRGATFEGGTNSASLEIVPAEDPTRASPWELLDQDGNVQHVGFEADIVVVGGSAEEGEERCYTLVQYLPDGNEYATSEAACYEVEEKAEAGFPCGCTNAGARTGSLFAGLFGALLVGRRRRSGSPEREPRTTRPHEGGG